MPSQDLLSLFEATRLGLAKFRLSTSAELSRGLERATEATARALSVERVGVWMWSATGTELRCVDLFELGANTHRAGHSLDVTQFPAYEKALQSRRIITAHDAVSHPETAELAEPYLIPNGIGSLLDAPLFHRGEVVGVVCHEHVGTPRTWTDRERDFAASVADMIAVLLEQATRLDLESALAEQRSHSAKLEKMDALARLGAGLAHDFNNVLSSMMLRAEVIRRKLPEDSALQEGMAALLQDGKLGARLVSQLLTYAKEEERRPSYVDVGRAIVQAKISLHGILGDAVDLVVEAPSQRLVVHADPAQLEQVVLNLAINARDAGARSIQISIRSEQDDVVVCVQDNGQGMAEETLRRVFEPFFTTKQQGTGLGLANVQSIVTQNGGTVEVVSTEGVGATFTIRLPRVE
jgi:two-component system, cell cycle sensor histidine kinase and response regulator CckA